MTNPTRQQIINAHEALEELKNVALSAADFCGDTENYLAWKSEILAALPPRPRPTMAEIKWDDEKHYLAEAEQEFYGNVIMLGLANDGFIRFFIPNSSEQHFTVANPKTLTPTGRRYTLTEVQE